MKKTVYILGFVVLIILGCWKLNVKEKNGLIPKYEANWESLSKYEEAAEWFKDAKFGIYAHWGVMSVPAYANDWYARNMHIEGSNEFQHHLKTYGHPSKFGYHDFVPMFKAECFNPETWAELFKNSGAKFAGLVAEHHDGWSNWRSEINPWNAYDMGPNRDVYGDLSKAIKARNMKLVASFHIARNHQIFQDKPKQWLNDTAYFPYNPKMPTSSNDPILTKMYGNISKDKFCKDWYDQIKEVIDSYSPDLIYFDSQTQKIPESYKQEFAAYYFNDAVAKNKQVVFTHKEGEFPKSVSLEDFEKGRMNIITKDFWLTDETISVGSWSYTDRLSLKPTAEIIHLLIDVVSKNGALMLNVSPRSDGTIPKDQQDVLLEIGRWLKTNGEAIYGSRPWYIFGEGPTKQEKSGMFLNKIIYTPQDIRFTTRGTVIYACVLGWPGNNKTITLTSFTKKKLRDNLPKVSKVSILGCEEAIHFVQNDEGIHLVTPEKKVMDHAFVIKIETEQ